MEDFQCLVAKSTFVEKMTLVMRTALLISTYNWPKALHLCIQSLEQQTQYPSEVLIADDGSDSDTEAVVRAFQRSFPVPVRHIWQEDEGFQLSKIRNKAIAACSADYIIQIDGDIIMEKHFIADHIRFAERNSVVVGSRCMLSEAFSLPMLRQGVVPSKREMDAHSNNFLNGRRFPFLSPFLARFRTSGKNRFYAKGCNMAFWRSDLLAINGYDESFVGWGREDSDLVVRLLAFGCYLRRLKMGGIEYHIYHKENDRCNEELNDRIMRERIASGSFFAENGILKPEPAWAVI